MKTANPAVQNDLSFYRRLLSQTKANLADDELIIKREEANKISIFLACPTPFLTALINALTKSTGGQQAGNAKEMTLCFSTMIKLCRFMLEDQQMAANFKDHETKVFVLRFMVIIYNIHKIKQIYYFVIDYYEYEISKINIKIKIDHTK